jgi:electron transfer flavoprotein alpha subunit
MSEILVLVEHRQGEIRDITFELFTAASGLAQKSGACVAAVVLAGDSKKIADKIKTYAHKILCIEDQKLNDFNSEIYQEVLLSLIQERKPGLTLIGHTSFGIDLAPALAVQLDIPLVTDCIGLELTRDELIAQRQMYSGKVNAKTQLKSDNGYVTTIRQGVFQVQEHKLEGEIENVTSVQVNDISYRKFIEYLEAAVGDVDITQSEIIVSVGRGIKEKDKISIVKELADSIGGVLACSRPIVDAGWLPKDRQVGSSGKTVVPKLYIAVGISGSCQHQMGMKGAANIVAINKDPNAPIFNIANYGIVDDLFKVVPVLKEKISELK